MLLIKFHKAITNTVGNLTKALQLPNMLSDVTRYEERKQESKTRGSLSWKGSLRLSSLSAPTTTKNTVSGPKRKHNGHDDRKLTGKFALCIGPKTSQPHDTWHKIHFVVAKFTAI